MYRLTVRDRVMIAHSLHGARFGPAQRLHGATFVVDAEVARTSLDADGVVADIGDLHDALGRALAPLAYRNLDDEPAYAGVNTTVEFLAADVWGRLAGILRDVCPGVTALKVTLRESDVAWASFEAPL